CTVAAPPASSPRSLHDALPISICPWRGAREGVYPQRYPTDRATKPRANWAQPTGRHVFWPEASLLAPYRSAAGYARRSRLASARSEEHTSELQSPDHLVCRLLL